MLHFEREQAHKRKRKKLATFYEIHEQPILILTFILSLQHFMTVQGMTALQPKLMSKFLCTDEGNPAIGRLVGSASFVSGIGTLLQTTAGVRTAKTRRRQLLCVCVTTYSLRSEAFPYLRSTAALITLLSQYLTPCRPASELVVVKKLNDGITFLSIVPVSFTDQKRRCRIPGIFTLYIVYYFAQIFVTVLIVWLACHVLTVKDVFPEDHAGRTDHLASAIGNTTWFRVPLPFQWGTPTLSWESAVTTVFVSIMNMMETVCDYYAYAVVSGLPPPPPRAINRGIFMEGLGCLLAACFGSGVLCGIQDINIGLLAVTKYLTVF
ncbi:hypothetical protein V5799_028165 [Amblyomma americanum]|uniref:Uncharacterized protein n=1 Tax=Amblyomma americanum TaxID=6943 RepID=A0AAQ4DDM9_AMBAM